MSSSPTSGGGSASPASASAQVEVTMPQMGVSVAEGTIVEWKKRPGDWIERDESIVEISTDKVETEVPSPAAGRVSELLVDVGQTVDVGTLLAKIDTAARPGEPHADEQPSGDGAAAQAGSTVVEPEAGAAGPLAGQEESPRDVVPEEGAEALPAPGYSDGDGHATTAEGPAAPISPVVRRIAAEHGVDLSQVKGSGRRGRVTKRDVLAYIEGGQQAEAGAPEPTLHIESPYREEDAAPAAPAAAATAPPGAAPAPAPAPAPAAVPTGTRELSLMRKQIGQHMIRSLQTAAHCTTIVEADMSGIEAVRGRLSYLPFVARATIEALREYPMLNATLEGDQLTIHDEVNLGIAVSLGEDGLIVPVVKNAQDLSPEGLGARIRDLAQRARSKKLTPDEVQGGTFTITNPGAFGALLATPIINQPQVAILDLEAVVKRPVVVEGDGIAVRPMTYFCMSWDHRALDGALAAQFLTSVRRHVEAWGN